MKKFILFLMLVSVVFAQTVTDTRVADKQIDVPAHNKYVSAKYNPQYFIKLTDTIEITIKLNGNIVKDWVYVRNPACILDSTRGLLFVAKLGIVEATIPE